ncbi:MAG: arsenate reductase (glutaredoxin) [Rhodobacteraceae bacterium]|nr:MAG: arsenate reductase (glutaredoxin) [Paracoccaceae bacterium]
MSEITIWHNPRCSKSRQTLALLTDAGHAPTIIEYKKTPPTKAEIQAALTALGRRPIEIIRTGDALFAELGLNKSDNDEVLLNAMAKNPALIERPIVFANGKAALGRPPETVLDIL